MHVFYASHEFSHRVVCPLAILKRCLTPKIFPYFMSLTLLTFPSITSGFRVVLPAVSPHLRETVGLLLVSLPCTLVWKLTPGRAPGNRSIWESVELLGQLQLSASFPGCCANLQSHWLSVRVLVIP